MTFLREHLAEYLRLRRAGGYLMETVERHVGQFCDWLAAHGKTQTFTIDDAVTWARLPTDAAPAWWGMRLGSVRTFAAYLNAIGADVPVPPRGILPVGPRRASPYIYSQDDLDALHAACPQVFNNELIVATMQTVIRLLAATGIRIGEALQLMPADIDSDAAVLTIRHSKNRRQRLIPLHPTTLDALRNYSQLPARHVTGCLPSGPLLVSTRGTGYNRSTIEAHYSRIVAAAGLGRPGQPCPRLHDHRHSFATTQMLHTYRTGGDPQRTLTLLSTWLGHTDPAHTYWYLTAVPQLMALAADRLTAVKEDSP